MADNNPSFRYASPDRYKLMKAYAKKNRDFQTPAENFLWRSIKSNKLGISFKRQFIIGDYIADFANIDKLLIIEVDGGYHSEPIQIEDDKMRTLWLERMGWHVIRFSNDEVIFDTKRVLNTIINVYQEINNNETSIL